MEKNEFNKEVNEYYKKIKNQEEKSNFEEFYIKLYETEDTTFVNDALFNSKYRTTADIQFELHEEMIIFYIYKENLAYSLYLYPTTCKIDIDNDPEDDLDYGSLEPYDNITKELEVTYDIDITKTLTNILNEMYDLEIYFLSEERQEDLREELFSMDSTKKLFDLYLKGDTVNVISNSTICLLVLLTLIFSIKNTNNTFANIFISIMLLGFLVYLIYYIEKIHKLKKFRNKIEDDTSVIIVKGVPTKVTLLKKGTTSKYASSELAYVILTIDNVKYLGLFPKLYKIKHKQKKELTNKLLNMSFTLNVNNESHIINLKDSKLYDVIIKTLEN